MRRLENFVNNFAELTAMGFGLSKIDKNSDEYIDYFG